MKLGSVLTLVENDSSVSKCDAKGSGGAYVGHEDVLPERCFVGGTDVLHIQHVVFQALIENTRLHFKRCLRGYEGILKAREGHGGAWRNVQAVEAGRSEEHT